jgi:hypothetical protein
MNSKLLIGTIFLLMVVAGMPPRAAAGWTDYFFPDFWARYDRPWEYWELRHAIAFCRIQPRVDPGTDLFVDLVEGKQIDRCMRALGWVPVAR